MFNYDRPFSFHFELTDKCNARCPQCSRNTIHNKTGVLSQRTNLLNKSMTYNDYKKVFYNFNYKINKMLYCGNFGDPIAAKDFKDIIKYTVKSLKPTYIQINTNGGLKTTSWWKEMGTILSSSPHKVIFAIDGLEDTHSKYRVNTDFNKIIDNAKAFISSGGKAEWSLIIFKHNQHQVEEVRKQAENIGFESFSSVETQRFGIKEEIRFNFKGEDYLLEPADINKQEVQATTSSFMSGEIKDIDCISQNRNEIFIDPAGEVYPCCWIGSRDYADRYLKMNLEKDSVYELRPSINCVERPLEDCLRHDWFEYVLPISFVNKPCKTCNRVCGHGLRKKNNRQELGN